MPRKRLNSRPRLERRAAPYAAADPARPDDADISRRFAFEAWLDARADVRVRLVTGPPGSGKTSALRAWAHERPAPSPIWIALAPGSSPEALVTDIIASMFVRAAEGAVHARLEVVIDGIDDVSPEARDVLRRLVFRGPANVSLIYIARSPATIDLRDGDRHGLVAISPPALLAIDPADVATWCERQGVTATAAACAELAERTEGNAAAIAAVIRLAHEQRLSLVEATARRHEAVATNASIEIASTSRAIARGRSRSGGAIEPAIIEMFGRFRMRFGTCEVQFVRRRDRQIVQYLALRPDGKATRAELMAEFWPDTDRRDAARRLRTACSTIRRAISACVGNDALDAYFRTEGANVVLPPENVINEADAFEEHLAYARRAGERGDLAIARRHVAAALRLHDRPLLSGEPPAPWIVDRARICEELAAGARQFLFGDVEGTRIA